MQNNIQFFVDTSYMTSSFIGNLPKARLIYNQLLISKSKLSPLQLAIVCKSFGNLVVSDSKRNKANLGESIHFYSQALNIERKIYFENKTFTTNNDIKLSLVYTLINLGNVHRKLKSFSKADDKLKEALNLVIIGSAQSGTELMYDRRVGGNIVMKLYIDLGKVAMRRHQFDEALKLFEVACNMSDLKHHTFYDNAMKLHELCHHRMSNSTSMSISTDDSIAVVTLS